MPMKSASRTFAEGVPKFSWQLREIADERGRFVCECKSHPHIVGFGNSEQTAIQAARRAMEAAVDKDSLEMPSPGQLSEYARE